MLQYSVLGDPRGMEERNGLENLFNEITPDTSPIWRLKYKKSIGSNRDTTKKEYPKSGFQKDNTKRRN